MDRPDFQRRLERAAERARRLAGRFVVEPLPSSFLFILPEFDDPRGSRGPEGTIKYFGGRFLPSGDLHGASAARAADLLWVDGRVPKWVNLSVEAVTRDATVIRMHSSHSLSPADEDRLKRDIPTAVDPSDPVEPFRIRGPAMPPGWRSVELDGRITLRP